MNYSVVKNTVVILFLLFFVAGCASDDAKKQAFLTDAKNYIEKQEYNKAVIQLKNVLKIDPKSIEANELLIQAYAKLGKIQEVFLTCQKLEQIEPENLDIKLEVASGYLLAKKFSEAADRVEQVLEKNPDSTKALYIYAAILVGENKNPEKIKEVYLRILKKHPDESNAHMVLSSIFLRQKDKKAAEKHLKAAISLDHKNLKAHKILMDLYIAQNNAQKAQDLLENSIKNMPDNFELQMMLAGFYLNQNKGVDAERTFLSIIDKYPEKLDPYMLLARHYNNTTQYAKAEEYILKALEFDPDNIGLKTTYADFYYRHKNFPKADVLLNQVLEQKPDYRPAKAIQGKIFILKKDYDKAVGIFSTLVEQYPTAQEYNFLLAQALYLNGKIQKAYPHALKAVEINPNLFSARFLLADIHFRKKEYSIAEMEIKKALMIEPEEYNALILSGDILAAQKKYGAALDIFDKAIQVDSSKIPGYFKFGVISRLEGNDKEAMHYLEKALAINPNMMDVFINIIAVYSSQKQYDQAVQRCDRQLNVVSGNPVLEAILYNVKGNLFRAKNDIGQARVNLEQAIKLNPEFATPYIALADMFKAENNLNDEIKIYEALIQKRDDQSVAHDRLGVLYEKKKEFTRSEAHYKKALEINADYIPAMNNLAYFYAQQDRDLNKALTLAQSAKEKVGDNPAISDTLGWVYYKKGIYESALMEFITCVESIPDNPVFQFHAGLAYHKLGEYDKAETAFKKALALKNDFEGSSEARKILEQLKSNF